MRRLHDAWPLAGRTSWLVATGCVLALLTVLAFFDAELLRLAGNLPAAVVLVFDWITRLGESDYILIGSLALWLVAGGATFLALQPLTLRALRQAASVGAFVFCGVGFPSLVSAIVKRLVGRARPEAVDGSGILDFQTMSWLDWMYQSFPSGHATTAFALCFVVSFLAPRAFPYMLSLAATIAASRVVLGVHYTTDIVGGAVVGVLGAYFVRNVFASRGWLFEVREHGAIAAKSLDAIVELVKRRG